MRIGLTIGVWDCFHRGHADFLRRAREHCDYLVVGVMTDYWVRVQKGRGRPAQHCAARMAAALAYADRVIRIDTLDMSQYLQMADVWILGADQHNMRPAWFPGDMVRLPRTPGVSSTEIIEQLTREATA